MRRLRRKIVVCVSLLLFAISAIAADRVRVSVFSLFHPKQITLESKQALLVKAGKREFVLEPGSKAVLNLFQGKVSVAGTVAYQVSIASRDGTDDDFELAVPGKIRRIYHGQVSVLANGTELESVVSMDLETAVASVNAAESTLGATMEALKAQAVAIRSYLVAGKPRHKDSDFCDTTHCQFLKAPPPKESLPAQATEATRGLVLSWDGKPFAAMYSASCAGRTHSLAEIGYKDRDYPYFAVDCEYCRKNPERWTATVSQEDAATLALKSEVERVRLARKLGWNTVPSNDHQAKVNGTMVDLAGVGRGHGLGLCQRGAAAMAREGKSFREILEHYFPNAEIKSVVSSF
jgi:stage II sporulation protein D